MLVGDENQGVWHTVEQGEWLNSIVREAGVGDPERVWTHPKNARLAARRQKEVLFPGDKLYLPAPQPRQESCAGGQRHVFQVPTNHDSFQVKLEDPNGKAYANLEYRLVLDGQTFKGTTDGDGGVRIEKLIMPSGASGFIEVPSILLRFPVQLGSLNPTHADGGQETSAYDNGLSGVLMCLRNLGYYSGEVEGLDPPDASGRIADPEATGAIMGFQITIMGRDPAIANGLLDGETRQAIKKEFSG